MTARVDAREMIDGPVDSLAELEGNLRDIARANRLFGGIGPVARELARLAPESILDVGCGLADVPRALARRIGGVRIVCLDSSEQILELARRHSRGSSALEFVRGEATELPFEDEAFDVVTCSLTLHHLAPPAARALLAEMRRVAKRLPVVCDLRRSRTAYAATWLYTRLFTRNRLTRHDGPLSVLRAYTPGEALRLAREAGWRAPHVRSEPWFRMTLTDG
ncbi:MAG: methyltransferase domain-containing protein [Candidatus Eremiobacteraeota bacterium]|nr:methyltransferase domain-containing protein [Candidatus Eremiobacteraeota bacterium]